MRLGIRSRSTQSWSKHVEMRVCTKYQSHGLSKLNIKISKVLVWLPYWNQRWRPTQWSNLLDLANFELSASKYRVSTKFQCSSSFRTQDSDLLHLLSAAILEFKMAAMRLGRRSRSTQSWSKHVEMRVCTKYQSHGLSKLNIKISKVLVWLPYWNQRWRPTPPVVEPLGPGKF